MTSSTQQQCVASESAADHLVIDPLSANETIRCLVKLTAKNRTLPVQKLFKLPAQKFVQDVEDLQTKPFSLFCYCDFISAAGEPVGALAVRQLFSHFGLLVAPLTCCHRNRPCPPLANCVVIVRVDAIDSISERRAECHFRLQNCADSHASARNAATAFEQCGQPWSQRRAI